MSAHALSFQAPRRVGIAQRDLPPIGPGETLVRTLYSGISSGTELLAYRGQIDPSLPLDESIGALAGTFTFPFFYGYSCVGRVERSDSLPPGALVFAYHPHQNRFVAATRELIVLGDTDARQATLLPLVETALQVVLDAGMVTEEPVVVLGLGLVGMLTALLLARAGARVTAGEPRQWRRALACSLGVDAVDPGNLPDAVKGATGGDGVSLVVDASGNPDVLPAALDLLAHEGQVLVASWYGTKEVRLPLGGAFHRRRLAIRSTQVSTIPSQLGSRWTIGRRREAATRLLDELPLAPLATHTFSFEEAAAAFAALDRGDEGILHVALSYDR
jgi:2-desacetyl-2-hydroxyethyl bacteriochlorophyllide A dehydrogenase